MSSPLEKFASRVVCKKTGPNRYIANCSAHEDKSPSLTIRELDDGRILLHCHAGCSVHEVLSAIGLELSDLFPEPITARGKPERRPFPAADCLRAVAFEGAVILSVGAQLLQGQAFDRERLVIALERINGALTAAGLGVKHG